MGYLQGISPLISFLYGANNTDKLKKIFRNALITVAVMSVITFILAFPLAVPLSRLYANGVDSVLKMAVSGIRIYAFAFLIMGFNLFGSAFFTALNDGRTSAILAICRTLIFLIIPLLILPNIFDINGVWMAPPTAELLSVFLTFRFISAKSAKKDKYHYA